MANLDAWEATVTARVYGTVAALVGEDWNAVQKRAAAALPGVVRRDRGARAGR